MRKVILLFLICTSMAVADPQVGNGSDARTSPEDVAKEAILALRNRSWMQLAEVAAPRYLHEFAMTVRAFIAQTEEGQGFEQRVFGEVRVLEFSDVEIFVKVMEYADQARGVPQGDPALLESEVRIVGTVAEGDSIHVVFRATSSPKQGSLNFVSAIPTVPSESGYRAVPPTDAYDVICGLGLGGGDR